MITDPKVGDIVWKLIHPTIDSFPSIVQCFVERHVKQYPSMVFVLSSNTISVTNKENLFATRDEAMDRMLKSIEAYKDVVDLMTKR